MYIIHEIVTTIQKTLVCVHSVSMAITSHEHKLINYHKSTSDSLSVPRLMIEKKDRTEAVEYQVQSNYGITKVVMR